MRLTSYKGSRLIFGAFAILILGLFFVSAHSVNAATFAEVCLAQYPATPRPVEYVRCLAEARIPAFIASSTAQFPVLNGLRNVDPATVQTLKNSVEFTITEEKRLLDLIRSSSDRVAVWAAWLSANQDHEVFTLLIPKVNAVVAANNGLHVASSTLLFVDRVKARITILERRGVPKEKTEKFQELKALEEQIRNRATLTKTSVLTELNTILSAGLSGGDAVALQAVIDARVAARTRMKEAVTALGAIRVTEIPRALAIYKELTPRLACTLNAPVQIITGRSFSLAWNTNGAPDRGSISQGATVVQNTVSLPSGLITTRAPNTPGSYTYTMTVTKGVNSGVLLSANCEVTVTAALPRIRMSDYFPTGPLTKVYKTQSGRDYLNHVIEPVEPRLSLVPQTPPGTHYVLHDWIGGFYADTWHMLNGNDGSVSEIADSFASRTGCVAPCLGRMNVYNNQPIGHGPGGAIDITSPALNNTLSMWYTPDGVAQPVYIPDMGGWSSIKLNAIHETYTPEYGGSNGSFVRGGGKTYTNVIEVSFGHGVYYPVANGFVEPRCANQPALLPHVNGQSSFWQRAWLAPGVGWIKIENLFYEAYCGGLLGGQETDTPDNWTAYLDTMTASLPYNQNLRNESDTIKPPTASDDKNPSLKIMRIPIPKSLQ